MTDQRPEGVLLARTTALLTLLFALLGGRASPPPPDADPQGEGPAILWVFMEQDAWNDAATLEAVEASTAKIRVRSQWLRAVSVEMPPKDVHRLSTLPGVLKTRPVARWTPESPDPAAPVGTATRPLQTSPDSLYGAIGESLEAVGIPKTHELGFFGGGVRIGILDGTFLEDHVTIRASNPLAVKDFVDLDDSPFSQPSDPPGSASHGTALWSILAGGAPGTLVGGAPEAEILLARVRGFDAVTQVDEDRWVAALEWLESQGARVVLSGISFRDFPDSGYAIDDLNGDTTPATQAADEAARRGVLVVAPVGNNGPGFQSLEAPADGDSVLAVGAVDSRGTPAVFSAAGPTADGRAKPDLFAPGLTIQAASAVDQQTLEGVSGTEFAGAIIAGAVALAVEAYPNLGPMEILQLLSRSVPRTLGTSVDLPNTASAILFPEGLFPLPLQAVDGDGVVTDLAPQFQWTAPTLHPLGLPVTFFLELSEDSLFQGLAVSDSVVGTFARRPSAPLPPRTRLFWRVRARSVQGVERIAFASEPLSIPSWATLEVLNEPSGSEIADPQPEFRWSSPEVSPPAGPFSYELQILSDRESELIQSYQGLEETAFRLPEALPFNLPLRWQVIATAREGAADTVTSSGPFVVTSSANPPATILYQNFPNPFPNREFGGMGTRIWFDLAREGPVELAVYDVRGRLVRSLVPAPGCQEVRLPPGLYGREAGLPPDPCVTLSWNGRDERGREVDPGVYLLRLKAGGVVDVRRIVYWP